MLSAVGRRIPPAFAANWLNPLLFSWPIDREALASFLPDGLEIDSWGGNAYVSLVGIRFEAIRVFGMPAPVASYDEVNLRFYVRRKALAGDSWPGVVFIRQLVPSRVTAWCARVIYAEPFEFAAVGHHFDSPGHDGADATCRVAYHWDCRGHRQKFYAETAAAPALPATGSLDEFLTARHWGYNGKPGTRTRAYQLTRPPWPVRQTSRWELDCDVDAVYGEPFAGAMRQPPASALLAAGSRTAVSLPGRLPAC